MRGYHLLVGVSIVTAFLISGQWMRHHDPPLRELDDSVRLMFRSRHIYLLASGLINLMLGLYFQPRAAGWRRRVQTIGSGLLFASSGLLVLAFALEPEQGFQPEMRWSAAGLYTLFGGCMAHLASGMGEFRTVAKKKSGDLAAPASTSTT